VGAFSRTRPTLFSALPLLAIASLLIACGRASSDSPADSTPGVTTLRGIAATDPNLLG